MGWVHTHGVGVDRDPETEKQTDRHTPHGGNGEIENSTGTRDPEGVAWPAGTGLLIKQRFV